MEKSIGAALASRSFGKLLREVEVNGDKVVVERNGHPVAVVVPVNVYEQWKQQRELFFNKIREIQEKINLSPEAAEKLAEEAVQAVRRNKAQ